MWKLLISVLVLTTLGISETEAELCLCTGAKCMIINGAPTSPSFANQCTEARKHSTEISILHYMGKVLDKKLLEFFPKTSIIEISFGVIEKISSDLFESGQIASLSIKHNELFSLDENLFAKAENLTNLDLNFNHIDELPKGVFKNLINLERMYLSYNNISELAPQIFASLKNLTVLNLSKNNISSLDPNIFDGLDKLVIMDISFNKLKTFDFSNLKLTHLLIQNNSLEYLVTNNYYREVYASFNKISTLNADENNNLSKFVLVDNKLSDIKNISKIRSLTYLALGQNELSENTVFSNLANLESLHLHKTAIKLHPAIFSDLISLRELDLSLNNLTEIDFEIFKEQKYLEHIVLSGNMIQSLDYKKARNNLPRLHVLEVCGMGWNRTYLTKNLESLANHSLSADKIGFSTFLKPIYVEKCAKVEETRKAKPFLESFDSMMDYNDESYSSYESESGTTSFINEEVSTETAPTTTTSATVFWPTTSEATKHHVEEHGKLLKAEKRTSTHLAIFHGFVYFFATLGVIMLVMAGVFFYKRSTSPRLQTIWDSMRLL